MIGPNAMPSKGFEITDEEHAARQVCKILGTRGLEAEELKAEWLVVQQETSGRVRSGLGEQGWDKALQGAASRGWIAERDGQYFATEAGQSIAKRSRAATGKSRVARLRSARF